MIVIIVIIIIIIIYSYFNNNYNYPKEIPNFLSHDECNLIIDQCQDNFIKSAIYKGALNTYHPIRESYQHTLDDDNDMLDNISNRIAILTNTNVEEQEKITVIKYNSNGYYYNHYDACGAKNDYCKKMIENYNNKDRLYTVIIYLNDDYIGGETVFPNLNKHIKPEKGKAILFKNIDSNGNIIKKSLHRGNPVTGVKYICNIWIHDK